jgi:hypothetical protein
VGGGAGEEAVHLEGAIMAREMESERMKQAVGGVTQTGFEALGHGSVRAREAADKFFAEKSDKREDVPEEAAGEGEVTVADGDFFAVAAPGAGVARAAGAAGGDAEGDGFKAHAAFPEADVEIVVGLNRERGVEALVFGEERAAVERGLVVGEVARDGIHVRAELVDAAIVEGGFAGGDPGFGLPHPVNGFAEDHVADEAVVGTEEVDPFAGGAGDAFVHGVVNARVGFRDEHGEAGAAGFEPLARAIGGAAVDDDDLGGEVELLPDAAEGGVEAGAGVFADENDAEWRRGGGGHGSGKEEEREAGEPSTLNGQRSTLNVGVGVV